MNVASVELCKKLYDLSGWKHEGQHNWYWRYLKGSEEWELDHIGAFPAYDLGYLFRRLPSSTELSKENDGYIANCLQCSVVYKTLSTPEDAIAKLAIEMYKQGVLE